MDLSKVELKIKLEENLFKSVENNNIKQLMFIINKANRNKIKLNINIKNKYGFSPVLCAIYDNNLKIVQLLIDYATKNNINIDMKIDKKKYTPFIGSVVYNNFKMFKILLEYYIHTSNEIIIINENILVEIIKKNEKHVNLKNISEIKPEILNLMYIYKNNFEIIYSKNSFLKENFKKYQEETKKLKKKELSKEKLNKINKEERKKNGKKENQIIINNEKDDNDTQLTFECKKGNIEEVKKLIEKGEDINEKNKIGDTPLIIACKNGNIELVEYLLSNENIDINMMSNYGMNPLLVACYYKNKDLVDCLLNHNANVYITDNKNSPFHISCYLNSTDITRSLVENESLPFYDNKQNNEIIINNFNNNEMLKSSSILTPLNSVCLIKYVVNINNERMKISGSGFFIEIPINSNFSIKGLMTNNHVLNDDLLKPGKSFDINIPNYGNYTIEINKQGFIFTSELIDVTFIELNEEIIKEINLHFLQPNIENGKIKDANIGDFIMSFQYPNDVLSYAHGFVENFNGFDYYHGISTGRGSSGSALLNINNKVVGIHISCRFSNMNVALKISEVIYAVRMLYNNRSIYGIIRARMLVRELKETEIQELEEYGIKQFNKKDKLNENGVTQYKAEILKKSLFQCNKYGHSLLLYRTNYSWYITLLYEEINILNYGLNYLKTLDWCPIIPNSEILNENIISKINEREYILIIWLKLTELKYL